jgi:hypothetical protein
MVSTNNSNKQSMIIPVKTPLFESIISHLMTESYNELIAVREDAEEFENNYFTLENNVIRFRATSTIPPSVMVEGITRVARSGDNTVGVVAVLENGIYNYSVHYFTPKAISEGLKFTNKGAGMETAPIKVPATKKEEFITDVSRKFNLKQFTRYGMEIYGTSSSEASNKYYILKAVDGKIYACLNAGLDRKVHRDIEAFRKYVENLVDKYLSKEKEEKKIDESVENINNGSLKKAITDGEIPTIEDISKFSDPGKEYYLVANDITYAYRDKSLRDADFSTLSDIITTGNKGIGRGTPKAPAPQSAVPGAQAAPRRLPSVSTEEPIDNLNQYKPSGSTKKSSIFSVSKVKDLLSNVMDKIDIQLAYAVIFNKLEEYNAGMEQAILQKVEQEPNDPNVNYVFNAFIKESADNLITSYELRGLVGTARAWDIISTDRKITFGISENNIIHKFRKIAEGKYIVEATPLVLGDNGVDGIPAEVVADPVAAEVANIVKPGDEIETTDGKTVYFVDMGDGNMMIVAPDAESAALALSALAGPRTAPTAPAPATVAPVTNESKGSTSKLSIGKIRAIHKNSTRTSIFEKKSEGGIDKLLSTKGFKKDGDAHIWDKHSTTFETYSILINNKKKTYQYLYTAADKKGTEKKSHEFTYTDVDDIIIPSSMDEFDHIMKLTSDKLFHKGEKVLCKKSKEWVEGKIKSFDFGTYKVSVDGKDTDQEPSNIKNL